MRHGNGLPVWEYWQGVDCWVLSQARQLRHSGVLVRDECGAYVLGPSEQYRDDDAAVADFDHIADSARYFARAWKSNSLGNAARRASGIPPVYDWETPDDSPQGRNRRGLSRPVGNDDWTDKDGLNWKGGR